MFKEGTEAQENFKKHDGFMYKGYPIVNKSFILETAPMSFSHNFLMCTYLVYDRSLNIALGTKTIEAAKRFIDDGWLENSKLMRIDRLYKYQWPKYSEEIETNYSLK